MPPALANPPTVRLPAAAPTAGWTQRLRDLWPALPSQCAICRAWPTRPLCPACVARFAPPVPRCSRCALRVPEGIAVCGACLRQPPPFNAGLAACDYDWPWAGTIARFKFGGQPGWAGPLARLMHEAPGVREALQAADRVLPIPLHPQRLRERGFNQSLELARRLAPTRCDATLLRRVRDTPAQRGLTREERLRNLRGAFVLDPQRAASLRGQRLVLVDDVMTTGASLACAADALRAAGAAHITALVLARTAPGDDSSRGALPRDGRIRR